MGKRELKKTGSNTTGKVFAKSIACGAANTAATIFGSALIGKGVMNAFHGIKDHRGKSIAGGIMSIFAGTVVMIGNHITEQVMIDHLVNEMTEAQEEAMRNSLTID